MTLEQLAVEVQGLKADIAQIRKDMQPVVDQHKPIPPQVLEQIERMSNAMIANGLPKPVGDPRP